MGHNPFCPLFIDTMLKPLFTSPRTSSGQAGWPNETVPIRTILNPSEGGRKSQGENHQVLAVNGEKH